MLTLYFAGRFFHPVQRTTQVCFYINLPASGTPVNFYIMWKYAEILQGDKVNGGLGFDRCRNFTTEYRMA